MCRYILAVPPKDTDKQHNLRMIYGNGLRPQIWTEFLERFNIKKVGEFYGATEGNANIGKSLKFSHICGFFVSCTHKAGPQLSFQMILSKNTYSYY